jgi:hypothetical protein
MEQLINHSKQEIRDFAKENIKYFEEKIQREKTRDANYGLEF